MKNSGSLFGTESAQVQVTKARKNAPAKAKAEETKTAPVQKAETKAKPAKAEAKGRTKPAAKAATKTAAPKGIAFVLMNRPSSGKAVEAHTETVLRLTGMYDGAEVDKKLLREALGDTAISYHKRKGTIEEASATQLKLTEGGKFFFSERFAKSFGKGDKGDSELGAQSIAPFVKALTTGEASDADFCRNAAMFKKLG